MINDVQDSVCMCEHGCVYGVCVCVCVCVCGVCVNVYVVCVCACVCVQGRYHHIPCGVMCLGLVLLESPTF